METLIISLLPYIIASAVVPLQVILGLLLLKSPEQGLLKAIAFVSGKTITRLAQGLIFGWVLAGVEPTGEDSKNLIASTLLVVLGILLLIAAYKKWSHAEDPDDPPPKWLTLIDRTTPLKALGIGLVLPLIAAKLWVFTLSALTTIAAAQLEQPTSTIAYLLFILVTETPLLLAILLRIFLPKQAQAVLMQASDWLTRYNRPISITVALIFGFWFLASGIKGLMA
jgi:hypothetical protein